MAFDLSKTQFLNSIKQQMETFGVDSAKQAELQSEAESIFGQYDKQNADGSANESGDGSWNIAENQNADSVLSKFMQSIAEFASDDFGIAIARRKSDPSPVSNPIDETYVAQADDVEAEVDPQQAVIDNIKSMSPIEQIEYIEGMLETVLASGGNIVGFDGDVITIEIDGVTQTDSLSAMGLSEEAINEIKPLLQTFIEGEVLDAELDQFEAELNMSYITEVTGFSKPIIEQAKEFGVVYNVNDDGSITVMYDNQPVGAITKGENGEMVYDSGAVNTTFAITKQLAELKYGKEVDYEATEKELTLIYEKDNVRTHVVIDKSTGRQIRAEQKPMAS